MVIRLALRILVWISLCFIVLGFVFSFKNITQKNKTKSNVDLSKIKQE